MIITHKRFLKSCFSDEHTAYKQQIYRTARLHVTLTAGADNGFLENVVLPSVSRGLRYFSYNTEINEKAYHILDKGKESGVLSE